MIKSAIEKIQEMDRKAILTFAGRDYIHGDYTEITEHNPSGLSVNNLSGIRDFVKKIASVEGWDKFFIHVKDYNQVVLYRGKDGTDSRRIVLAQASCRESEFQFGSMIDREAFVISMFSMFLENNDRKDILSMVSGVKLDENTVITDDGNGQTMMAKSGVSSKMEEIRQRPVYKLKPFRTFDQIDQPESLFNFRWKKSGEKSLACALYGADGQRWKQDAINSIAEYFATECPKIPVIA